MEVFECPVCADNLYYEINRRMLFSDVCQHRLCDRCVDLHFSQLARGQCPICRASVSRLNYKEENPESEGFQNEKDIRKRVSTIYNDKRSRFEDTPKYNLYLENKEETIYCLVFGKDETKRRKVETQLRLYEKENAKRIAENNDIQKGEDKLKIKEIVEKEGVFYELTKQALRLQQGNQNTSHLSHPLQRHYAQYFKDEKNAGAPTIAEGQPKPLDASIKEETDLPRRKYKTKAEIEKAIESGGYSRDLVYQRAKNELFGGLLMSLRLE